MDQLEKKNDYFSNLRITTFEDCSYRYKLRYIDKLKSDFSGIEVFMGQAVHYALEQFYRDFQLNIKRDKQDIINYYNSYWDKGFNDKILIVKKDLSASDYRSKGIKFLWEYFDRFKPFLHHEIIDVEVLDTIKLSNDDSYYIKIDLLTKDEKGTYFVCDYKTGNKHFTQSELDQDLQLPMYALWVKKRYPDAMDIKLVWFYLSHNTVMISNLTDKRLMNTKKLLKKRLKI